MTVILMIICVWTWLDKFSDAVSIQISALKNRDPRVPLLEPSGVSGITSCAIRVYLPTSIADTALQSKSNIKLNR